jgi:glucose dehydrogenase
VKQALLLLATAGFLCAQSGAAGDDWPHYGGAYGAWRYSALAQVDRRNVQLLAPVWVLQTGDYENGLQATPIASGGVLYLSTSNSWVFALEGATGRLIWEYRFPLSKSVPLYGKQNRGVAVGRGHVFLGTADNHLVGLDQATGEEVWQVNVEDTPQCGCNITGAPLVVKDTVITGVTGGDSAHRGYLTAFDAVTGHMRWRFHTIPGPGDKGHET